MNGYSVLCNLECCIIQFAASSPLICGKNRSMMISLKGAVPSLCRLSTASIASLPVKTQVKEIEYCSRMLVSATALYKLSSTTRISAAPQPNNPL